MTSHSATTESETGPNVLQSPFLTSDHHGTASLAIDATTLAATKRYTTPFGAPLGTASTAWPDDKAFLGKPADATTGLTHIGAREYDPGIGQFISVDPVLALDQHQSLNGYAYANNNPPTFSDPTGLMNADVGSGCTNHCEEEKNWVEETILSESNSGGGTGDTGGTASGGGGTQASCPVAMGTSPNCGYNGQPRPVEQPYSYSGYHGPLRSCSGWLQCAIVYAIAGISLAIITAPAAMAAGPELAAACLANPAGCAEVASEIATGGAAGGSLVRVGTPVTAGMSLKQRVDDLYAKGTAGKGKAALAGELHLDGSDPEILLSISGEADRKGFVPNVGDSGNPARFVATATGRNPRQADTEYKMLTYVANMIGKSSSIKGSLTMHSSQTACISCSSVIGQFWEQFPNIRINYTSGR
ncbi:RHS repeat-associated core domain-containing protein [Streptomyces sp. NPDC005408]|uniref:RHS repeat-associated core domain-containing protein n=1 Tax=Streptomyces sp. NPDC005408 TaxID=3155341 RepID=UPI0033BADB75